MAGILRRALAQGLVGCALAATTVGAQTRPGLATTFTAGTNGADTVSVVGTIDTASTGARGAQAAPAAGTQALVANGALWRRTDDGAGWVPKVVSIGAEGTQVFSLIEFGQDHAELISGFSPDPATPAWTAGLPAEGTNACVDSAETADVHASVHQLVLNGNNTTRSTVVCRWRSGQSAPDWAWTFPGTTSGIARVGISADGGRVVAAALYPMEFKVRVAVFQGTSGTPVYSGEIPNFGVQLRGFDLSTDGLTLYAASSSMAYVWRTDTHAVIGQSVLTGGYDAHALAGDGNAFAWGEFNKVHVWQRNSSGTFTQTHVRELPGAIVCDRLGFSADGATLAIGWHYYDQNLRVRIEAMDVPSKAITMAEEPAGTGSYQNVVSAVSVSDDGSRFAVGLWGDQGDVCPEVRLYRRNQSAPAALHNLTGSVYDLDLSGDGQRVAVAWKSVHANTFAGGGGFSLFAFDEPDLRVTGVPSSGASLAIDMTGPANSPARLLWSRTLAATPVTFGGIGTLHLPRTEMTVVPIGSSDAAGGATAAFALPAQAAQVGTTLYFQGLYTTPRRLTSDWARVTILP